MRKQCKACPWRKDCVPCRDIPNGYSRKKHERLRETINEGLPSLMGPLKIFACHESMPGREIPCVGWLANQLGPGNNLGLRLAVIKGRISDDFELVGEQHETLEDTLR